MSSAGFKSVRITFEVSPALNVRMSMRLAGPHRETTNNQDHAAKTPSRISPTALTQREALISSRMYYPAGPKGPALLHVDRHLHAAVISADQFVAAGLGRRGPLDRPFLIACQDDLGESRLHRDE